MATYEALLDQDFNWALDEAGRHFECANSVHGTLRRLVARLDDIGVEYAVIGAMAMFFHGYRRFTQDVDVIVTSQGLAQIEESLVSRGYIAETSRRKRLRDVTTGVRIDVFTADSMAGPDSALSLETLDPFATIEAEFGVKILALPQLMELKIRAGQDSARLRHLGDAQEMIRVLDLTYEFRERISASLRRLFDELWEGAQRAKLDDY